MDEIDNDVIGMEKIIRNTIADHSLVAASMMPPAFVGQESKNNSNNKINNNSNKSNNFNSNNNKWYNNNNSRITIKLTNCNNNNYSNNNNFQRIFLFCLEQMHQRDEVRQLFRWRRERKEGTGNWNNLDRFVVVQNTLFLYYADLFWIEVNLQICDKIFSSLLEVYSIFGPWIKRPIWG